MFACPLSLSYGAGVKAKIRWRKILHHRVAELDHGLRKRLSRVICRRLWYWVKDFKPRRMYVFAPLWSEPDLWPLYEKLLRHKAKLYFPRITGRTQMYYYGVKSRRDLVTGAFRILEPTRRHKAPKPTVHDIILVPCVGLDRAGRRLGHGNGYFDRWLRHHPHGTRIAVLFSRQMVKRLPHAAHDAKVHLSMTEKGAESFL